MKYNPRYNNVLNRKSYLKKGVPSNSEGRNWDSLLCLLNKGIVLCYKINNRWEEIGAFKKLDKKFNNSLLNKLTVDTITSDSDLLITNNNVGSTSTRLNDINLEPKGMVFINKDYDTTRAGESQVKRLVKEYLGPVFGGNIAESQINKWAGMLRNDPDAEIQIKETMLNMKKGLFGEYNDELTYEEIAAPWRGFTTNVWGGTLDETSNLFQDVLKANDVSVANQLLFDAGLQDGGSKKIQQDVLNSLVGSFGPGVRRML